MRQRGRRNRHRRCPLSLTTFVCGVSDYPAPTAVPPLTREIAFWKRVWFGKNWLDFCWTEANGCSSPIVVMRRTKLRLTLLESTTTAVVKAKNGEKKTIFFSQLQTKRTPIAARPCVPIWMDRRTCSRRGLDSQRWRLSRTFKQRSLQKPCSSSAGA